MYKFKMFFLWIIASLFNAIYNKVSKITRMNIVEFIFAVSIINVVITAAFFSIDTFSGTENLKYLYDTSWIYFTIRPISYIYTLIIIGLVIMVAMILLGGAFGLIFYERFQKAHKDFVAFYISGGRTKLKNQDK